MSSNSRRVRSALTPSAKAWNWSARICSWPTTTGPPSTRASALAAAHDGLDAGHQLLGMARLGDPIVRAHPQAAHALGDRRAARAHDHAEAREPSAQTLEVRPALGTQHREVDHERVEAHRHDCVERDRARQHAVLPAGGLQPLGEDLQESGVGIQDGQADR
jgi:hypothetical protein